MQKTITEVEDPMHKMSGVARGLLALAVVAEVASLKGDPGFPSYATLADRVFDTVFTTLLEVGFNREELTRISSEADVLAAHLLPPGVKLPAA